MCAIAQYVEQVQKHLYHLAEHAKDGELVMAQEEGQLAKQKLEDLLRHLFLNTHTSGMVK